MFGNNTGTILNQLFLSNADNMLVVVFGKSRKISLSMHKTIFYLSECPHELSEHTLNFKYLTRTQLEATMNVINVILEAFRITYV